MQENFEKLSLMQLRELAKEQGVKSARPSSMA